MNVKQLIISSRKKCNFPSLPLCLLTALNNFHEKLFTVPKFPEEQFHIEIVSLFDNLSHVKYYV